MRFTVAHARIAADRVLDFLTGNGHGRGAGDGLTVRLLNPIPNGVFAGFGVCGILCSVFAVRGGCVGHGRTLGGDIHRDRMLIAIAHAGVAGGGVFDFRRNDAVSMRQLCKAVHTFAGDFHGIAARRAGRCVELDIVLVVGEGPLVNACAVGRKNHGAAVADKAVLTAEDDLIADVGLRDGHGRRAFGSIVVFLLDSEPDGVRPCVGERGILC